MGESDISRHVYACTTCERAAGSDGREPTGAFVVDKELSVYLEEGVGKLAAMFPSVYVFDPSRPSSARDTEIPRQSKGQSGKTLRPREQYPDW